MSDKSNVWYQIRIVAIVLTSIVFLGFYWYYEYHHVADLEKVIINNWAKNQYKMVEELVNNATASNMRQDFDSFLLETMVPRFRYTETSYGFLYKDGNILFEQNAELTNKYSNNTIRNTYGSFSYYGGEHLLEVVEKMEAKSSGMDYFIKAHFKGKEQVTWVDFTYRGSNYIAGIATPEAYILNEYGFSSLRNDTYVFSSVYTVFMIFFAGMLCFFAYRFNETIGTLKMEVVQKKEIIRNDKDIISELEEKLKLIAIKDTLTGVYNRKYFDVLAGKLKDQIFLPISICIFDIDGFKGINTRWGHGKGDEILRLLAETCTEVCDVQDDVIARYGNDEIILLMINTPFELAMEKANRISETMVKSYRNDILAGISFGVSTKVTDVGSVYQTIAEAEEELRVNIKH